MVSDGGDSGQEARPVGAPLHLRQVPGRRVPAAPESRDHHRPLVRSRHGAGRGHGLAQAREDHHRRRRWSRSRTSGSTNGTFVNGEKIRKADLKDGDRILIGTSIIKIVAVDGEQTGQHDARPRPRSKMAVAADKRRRRRRSRCRAASRRSRCPTCCSCCRRAASRACWSSARTASVGKIFLRKGQIYFATIDERASTIGPRKAIVPHARLDAGLVRARAARRDAGARRDARLDRGAADGGHAPARRVPGGDSRRCRRRHLAGRASRAR